MGYVPVHGYRLRIAPATEAALRRLPFVAGWARSPQLKLQPELVAAAAAPAPATSIRVILNAGESQRRVVAALDGIPVASAPSGKDGAWRVVATVPADRLAAVLSSVASLPEVEAVEAVRTFRPMNQDAVWVHQSFVGPSPQQTPIFDHGIFGCGEIAAIADTAQDYDSCYFRDTVNGPPPVSTCSAALPARGAPAPNRRKDILYYNWSGGPAGEEDNCAGTITGIERARHAHFGIDRRRHIALRRLRGLTSPNRNGGDGLAPGAKLVMQEMGDGFEYLNELGGTLWNLTDVAFQNGARIHSNSWGGACYDHARELRSRAARCRTTRSRATPTLRCGATRTCSSSSRRATAGSRTARRPFSVGTPANAKSVLAVGSVDHGVDASTPSDFTSAGPVEDGRLGATVAAQGRSTVSAASDANLATNNCASCSLDGTSMSAPTAAGLAALVREYYAAGFLRGGNAQSGAGVLTLGRARQGDADRRRRGPGRATRPGADFDSGFGRVQLDRTLAFSGARSSSASTITARG